MATINVIRGGIPPGKTFGISPAKAEQTKQRWYCCIRAAEEKGAFEVEAGHWIGGAAAWEAHDDDMLPDAPIGWDACRRTYASAIEAATAYDRAKEILASRKTCHAALRGD